MLSLAPIYMPALTPTEVPAGRRFANNYTRLFVRYPSLEDSKLGSESLTVREKMKLPYDVANQPETDGSAPRCNGLHENFEGTPRDGEVVARELLFMGTNDRRSGRTAEWKPPQGDPAEMASVSFAEEVK
jgi:hypothetical protein